MDAESSGMLRNVGSSEFLGELPAEPDFMGFGPIAGGKRCMLAGLALTAARLTPQPSITKNPTKLQDMLRLTQPGGWGVTATAPDRPEPREFDYTLHTNRSQSSQNVHLETVNYAPEYNVELSGAIVRDDNLNEIEDPVLRVLIELMRNCKKIIVILDSRRFFHEDSLFKQDTSVISALRGIQATSIIPVITKSDAFVQSTEYSKCSLETQFEGDPESNQREFREFVHQQFLSKSDLYSKILEVSEHSMGHPIFFHTKKNSHGELVPKIPIQTYGFKNLLDLLATPSPSTKKSAYENQEQLINRLEAAEQAFQEAVARYASGSQTVARIRFRQARDTFKEAQQLIKESDTEGVVNLIKINFEEQASLPSMALKKFATLTDSTLETLSTANIELITDLEAGTNGMTPAVVADLEQNDAISETEASLLTILSWWCEGNGREFSSETAISRRYEQADYGFDQSR